MMEWILKESCTIGEAALLLYGENPKNWNGGKFTGKDYDSLLIANLGEVGAQKLLHDLRHFMGLALAQFWDGTGNIVFSN